MGIFRRIANALAPLTLAGALLAYWYPPLFLLVGTVFLWLFAATMFCLGLVLEPQEFRETLKQPREIALGVLTQYTVMSSLGFLTGYASGLPAETALGFVIVGAAPGAMASNVIVYLAGGAVAYSVALTTVSTLLAPILTPTLVHFLGGVFLPIPFWPMMRTIVLIVLLPLLLGMFIRRRLGKAREASVQIAPAAAVIAIVIICGYAVAANRESIASVGLKIFALVVLLNGAGYGAGWYLGRLYRFDYRYRLTLMIEIGMQNAGLGVALALGLFAPETALPGALFAVWCILTAAAATAYLRAAPGALISAKTAKSVR